MNLSLKGVKNLTIDDAEVIVCETKYGHKLVSLKPDVKKVYIEVTTKCNFDCTTCIRNSWSDALGQMEESTFTALLDQLKELPELEVVHFGGFGEPMSHPLIFTMLKAVKAMGLQVEMITNGSLLSEDAAEELISIGVDRLFISLDGPDEEVFNDIRQGADFHGVVANIKKLQQLKQHRQSLKPELGIEFVAMKRNFHKLPQVAKLATQLDARKLIVTNVMPYHADLQQEILYDLDDTKPLFGKDSIYTLMRASMPNMKLRTDRYCKFVEDKALTITQEGQVAPCYVLMHGHLCYIYDRQKRIRSHHFGNLRQRSLKQIWTQPDYALFRARVLDFKFPSCTDCRDLDGCSYTDDNDMDCWGNSPSCSECLWARRIIVCP